jgi:hypothetical protein
VSWVPNLLLSLVTFSEIGGICLVLDDLAVLKAEDVTGVVEARSAKLGPPGMTEVGHGLTSALNLHPPSLGP